MNIKPMLCETGTIADIESHKEWFVELKIDGERIIAIDGRLVNRRGNDVTDLFPEVKVTSGVVADGELVVFNCEGKSDFTALSKRIHLKPTNPLVATRSKEMPATLVVFDVLMVGDKNITGLPLKERRKFLNQVVGDRVKVITDLPVPLWDDVVKDELEGVVIKNPDACYQFRRSKDFIKVKNFKEKIIRFNGFEEMSNAEKGITLTNGLNRVACAGLQSEKVKELLASKGYVDVNVQYLSESADGHLRFPSFRELASEV